MGNKALGNYVQLKRYEISKLRDMDPNQLNRLFVAEIWQEDARWIRTLHRPMLI
jgi:hypothetical protein